MAENVGSTTPGRLELGSRSFYGSTSNNGSVIDEDSELSEEEEEWLLDEELAKDGLYRGNYKSLVWLFTFVPLTSVLAFVLLSVVPMFFWRRLPPSAFPYPPYLPFPLPEVLVSTALWSLSFLLRDVIFTVSQAFTSIFPFSARLPSLLPVLTSILAAILQSATSLILRQLAVPILLVPLYSTGRIAHPSDDVHKGHFPTWQDGAFRRVWWIALGWAAAEAVVAIKQGYESLALYKEVLVDPQHVPKKSSLMSPVNQTSRTPRSPANGGSPRLPHEEGEDTALTPTQHTVSSPPWQRRASNSGIHEDLQASTALGERQPLLTLRSRASNDPLVLHQTNESQRALVEDEVEQDLDELLKFKTREELEEVYGIPFIHIPVFLLCLHRVNSILGSLSATLILSAAYMRSPLAYSAILPTFASSNVLSSLSSDKLPPTPSSNRFLFVSFFTLLFIQTLLSLTHTPWILPRIGVHTFVYVGLLVWLGVFFVALGVWEVLT